MKIQIASDLHIEFERPEIMGGKLFQIEKTDADVIVLAGDVGVGFDEESYYCERLSQEHQKEVVFVLGNHSFYGGGNIDKIRQQWAEACISGVNYVDDGYPFIFDEGDGSILFTGGILWTDFNNYNGADMHFAEKGMNDFRRSLMWGQDSAGMPHWPKHASKTAKAQDDYIRQYMFTPRRSVDEHFKTKKWINTSLEVYDTVDKKVVVSHHLPCLKSISEEFRHYPEDQLNPAFASDMEDWIKAQEGINLWIHGHTHDSFDYTLDNNTRIVCNPRGYATYAENKEFNTALVVEI